MSMEAPQRKWGDHSEPRRPSPQRPARRRHALSGNIAFSRRFHPPPARPMIIESLLDTDLYKFTMMQVVLHHFPGAQVEYRFKCRNPGVDLTPYSAEIERAIADL